MIVTDTRPEVKRDLILPSHTRSVITLRDVSKSYQARPAEVSATGSRGLQASNGRVAALQGISLDVKRGEVLSILGPSGCGKSTALRLIAGLETPDEGQIWLDGRKVAAYDSWVPPEKRRVGLVFQDYALFPHLTVGKNIAFPLSGWPSGKRKQRIKELLHLVGLEGIDGRYPHELSGGQQQRVALARALAAEPDVVLLDEPFSSLDAENRAVMRMQVHSILKSLGSTVVFVTHDQDEALLLGDRVAIMSTGKVEQIGTPEEIFQHPASRFVAEFLGISSFLPAIVTHRGVQTELGLNPQVETTSLGTPVEVLIRPDDLSLYEDPLGEGRVIRSVFRGMDYLYEVGLPSGRIVQCLGEHTVRHPLGSRVRVEITAGHGLICFVGSNPIE